VRPHISGDDPINYWGAAQNGHPYTVAISGITGPVQAMCDDYAHGGSIGESWQANITNLGIDLLSCLLTQVFYAVCCFFRSAHLAFIIADNFSRIAGLIGSGQRIFSPSTVATAASLLPLTSYRPMRSKKACAIDQPPTGDQSHYCLYDCPANWKPKCTKAEDREQNPERFCLSTQLQFTSLK